MKIYKFSFWYLQSTTFFSQYHLHLYISWYTKHEKKKLLFLPKIEFQIEP